MVTFDSFTMPSGYKVAASRGLISDRRAISRQVKANMTDEKFQKLQDTTHTHKQKNRKPHTMNRKHPWSFPI